MIILIGRNLDYYVQQKTKGEEVGQRHWRYFRCAGHEQSAVIIAVELVTECGECITERGEASHLAQCWALKGRLAVARGDLAKAANEFNRSLAQARKLSMRPVCEACEAELAAIAALRSSAPLPRNVEV